MKKKIITLSVLACLAFTGVSAVIAKSGEGNRGGHHGQRGGDAMQIFKKLDLSAQQKADIKAVMQQTREDNSVFVGEKEEIVLNMRELMSMPVWDAQTARQIIASQMAHGTELELNKAQARHEIFNLLTDEQQAELASLTGKSKKGKREGGKRDGGKRDGDKHKGAKREGGKREGKMHSRLIKALELSSDQQAQWKELNEAGKVLKQDFMPTMKAHMEQEQALIRAESFDENAWLALQSDFESKLVEHRVLIAENKYQTMALLTAEQKEKFKKIGKKMKERRRN